MKHPGYDMLREATELRRTMRHMDKTNRPDVAEELFQRPELDDYQVLGKANQMLRGIKGEMSEVYIDSTMTPAQKRERLDELMREKNILLEQVVQDVEHDRKERAQ